MSQKNKPNTKRWNDDHPTKIRIRVVGHEEYTVNVSLDMRVTQLRKMLELATGIPYNIQRLTYLDAAELVDNSTLEDNDVVPGGAIDLLVWPTWSNLVEKAIMGQIAEIMELGVCYDIPFSSPITDYMDNETKMAWIEKRAFVVLCIGVHQENVELCDNILPLVKNRNTRTPLGRTPLHIAASQGKSDMLKYLLDKGFKLHAKDKDDKKAIDLASLFGHPESERFLFMSAWEELREKIGSCQKKKETAKSMKKEETVSGNVSSFKGSPTNPEEKPETMVKKLSTRTSKKSLKKKRQEDVHVDEMEEEILSIDEEIKPVKDVCPVIGSCQNSDSFRQYLLALKKQCRNFGYTASLIDDHLQWLDNVKYRSFHHNPVISENIG